LFGYCMAPSCRNKLPTLSPTFTKRIPHFDPQTTSQIESDIKSHLLVSQSNFATVINLITNALEAQNHEISALFHQQKINTLKNLSSVFNK
ncbi:uncharacterized protein VP01_11589g1, partial [Puccinia sorghi]